MVCDYNDLLGFKPFYLYPNVQCFWSIVHFFVKQRNSERMGQDRRESITLKTVKCSKPTNKQTNKKPEKKNLCQTVPTACIACGKVSSTDL